ncbi:MAG: 16S rRNA (cytosine(1402)-N(4))-methyltransferase RsmH, partial [Candidatus Paceibacterota bacterium]
KIVPDGKLLGIEWDGHLLKQLRARMDNSEFKDNIILINDSYVNLKSIAEENGFSEVGGILFDLGMSSWHLEEAGRGFSFQKDEPLDMRFGAYLDIEKDNLSAERVVNKYPEPELVRILKEYGEERFAKPIATAIVKARKQEQINSTFQLVGIIKEAVPFWYRRRKIHFATRTFQALRIAVNNELENAEKGLGQAIDVLKKGGRLAVISFHSLEDRVVKNFFRAKSKEEVINLITKKPLRASLKEITQNPRARSAKLRVAEKN